MQYATILLADDPPKADPQPNPAPGIGQYWFFLLIPIVLYFLMIRPGRKQEQQLKSMISGLKKNDKVQTIGGILGTVVSVGEKEDEVVLRIDDNARLRVVKSSIARNLSNEEAAKQPKEQKAAGA
jgi:preprotein translocase subunit YajC